MKFERSPEGGNLKNILFSKDIYRIEFAFKYYGVRVEEKSPLKK